MTFINTRVALELEFGKVWIRFVKFSFIPFGMKTGTGRFVVRWWLKSIHSWTTILKLGK